MASDQCWESAAKTASAMASGPAAGTSLRHVGRTALGAPFGNRITPDSPILPKKRNGHAPGAFQEDSKQSGPKEAIMQIKDVMPPTVDLPIRT